MENLILVRASSTAWAEASKQICCLPETTEDANGALTGKSADTGDNQNKLTAIEKGSDLQDDNCRLQGTVPLPLSPAGKVALKQIAAYLTDRQVLTIYSSGNESSGPTAQYLAELCQTKTKKIASLKELNCGLWQGLRIKDIKKRYAKAYRQWRSDPASICPPDGEALTDASERIAEAMMKLTKKNKDKTVAVVAAPIVAALIECTITGEPLENLWQIVDQGKNVKNFTMENTAPNTVPTGQLVATELPT
jgi:broad specificity phosphatase PhoE